MRSGVQGQCHAAGRATGQRIALGEEELQSDVGVAFRIVHSVALESALLIMPDEAVTGVGGKGEWAEAQRIHRRQMQQTEARLRRRQVGRIAGDQVVPRDEPGSVSQIIETRQWRIQTIAGMRHAATGLPSHRPEGLHGLVPANFRIGRKTGRPARAPAMQPRHSCRVQAPVPGAHSCPSIP